MREGIRSLHPDLPATSTFLRGTRAGRNPIDGACSKASVVNNYEDNSWAFVVITCLFA
jgi:hypothetical protein